MIFCSSVHKIKIEKHPKRRGANVRRQSAMRKRGSNNTSTVLSSSVERRRYVSRDLFLHLSGAGKRVGRRCNLAIYMRPLLQNLLLRCALIVSLPCSTCVFTASVGSS